MNLVPRSSAINLSLCQGQSLRRSTRNHSPYLQSVVRCHRRQADPTASASQPSWRKTKQVKFAWKDKMDQRCLQIIALKLGNGTVTTQDSFLSDVLEGVKGRITVRSRLITGAPEHACCVLSPPRSLDPSTGSHNWIDRHSTHQRDIDDVLVYGNDLSAAKYVESSA